jgi:eight-cysteine-cluster-containing protein
MFRTTLLSLTLGALVACNAHQEATRSSDVGGGTVAAVEEAVEQAQVDAAAAVEDEPVAEVQPDDEGSSSPNDGVAPAELPVDQPTPQMLYESCHDRLEGAEVDGECSVDADCGRAGCSQEVCVPAAKKGDVMTTCEILPCFGAVQNCGCHEGRCTWTLREQLEPTLPRIPIQVQ